jgi:hypothetical protein
MFSCSLQLKNIVGPSQCQLIKSVPHPQSEEYAKYIFICNAQNDISQYPEMKKIPPKSQKVILPQPAVWHTFRPKYPVYRY